jgi:hypothetical protein
MFAVAGQIAAIGAIACATIMLWSGRLPPPAGLMWTFGLLIGLTSVGLWVASAAIEIAVVKWIGRPPRRRETVVLVITPVLLAVTCGLLAFGLPCRLMFLANKPALDRWAQACLATPGTPPEQARIGSYEAYGIEPIPGGVKFFVAGSGFFRSGGGFAYSPKGPPTPDRFASETFTPIGGAWYVRTFFEE